MVAKCSKEYRRFEKNGLNVLFFKAQKKPPTHQPNGSAIPYQKALDTFQRTVIPYRDPVNKSDSKDKSPGPTHISGLFRKKTVFPV